MTFVTEYPQNSTELITEALESSILNWLFWLIEEASAFKAYLNWFIICISICGIFFNSIVIDVASKVREKTGGSKWMMYLAFWDITYLATNLFKDLFHTITGTDVRDTGIWTCKFFRYFLFLTIANSSAHLVMLAVDRALCITFPTWHYYKKWEKINPRMSWAITIFYILSISLTLYSANLNENGLCVTKINTFIKVYRVVVITLFLFVAHFVLLSVSNITFVYQLRKRRTAKKNRRHANAMERKQKLCDQKPDTKEQINRNG